MVEITEFSIFISLTAIAVTLFIFIVKFIDHKVYWYYENKQRAHHRAVEHFDKRLNDDFDKIKRSVASHVVSKKGQELVSDKHLEGYSYIDYFATQNFDDYKNGIDDFFFLAEQKMGHYFSFICEFIGDIENDKILTPEDKSSFITRLRTHISPNEHWILYNFCKSDLDLAQRIKEWSKKYDFLPPKPQSGDDWG